MQEHISSSFDNDLEDLAAMLNKISGMVQTKFNMLLNDLDASDDAVLNMIIDSDKEIDNLEHDIFNKTVEIIALRSPHAQDLRKVMIAPRIASSNERMGDMVRNIAKRLRSLKATGQGLPHVDHFKSLSQSVLNNVIEINDAVARNDVEKALKIWEGDVKIDEAYNELMQLIISSFNQEKDDIETMRHAMFIAKNIERIGDHATTVAELVHFRVHAEMISDNRPKQGDS